MTNTKKWTPTRLEKLHRYMGCLNGLAIGDSLGAPIEWAKPGFKPITDLRASRTHKLKKGEWTDDTSMALATAHSLIEKGFDPQHQLQNYLNWFRKGTFSANGKCVGIGKTTRESLYNFELSGKTLTQAVQTDPKLAGNGTIMRIAPIPMYARTLSQAGTLARLNSMTTHSNPICTEAADIFSRMIFLALKGKSKKEIFEYAESRRYSTPEIRMIFEKKTYKCNPPFIVGSGYVVKSLEAALWAFYKTRTFKRGALMAVNLGGDADTIGALFGQLAGAYYGNGKIPQNWKKDLHKNVEIVKTAHRLFHAGGN